MDENNPTIPNNENTSNIPADETNTDTPTNETDLNSSTDEKNSDNPTNENDSITADWNTINAMYNSRRGWIASILQHYANPGYGWGITDFQKRISTYIMEGKGIQYVDILKDKREECAGKSVAEVLSGKLDFFDSSGESKAILSDPDQRANRIREKYICTY